MKKRLKGLLRIIFGIFAGVLFSFIVSVPLLTLLGDNDEIRQLLTFAILFVSGFIAAYIIKSRGILYGVITGLIAANLVFWFLFLFIAFSALFFPQGQDLDNNYIIGLAKDTLIMALLGVIAGALGGFSGQKVANRKLKSSH